MVLTKIKRRNVMLKKVMAIVVGLSIILGVFNIRSFVIEANAEDTLSLYEYQVELARINEQYGTDYCFPTNDVLRAEGRTIEDVEKYFQQMTLEEFHETVCNAINEDLEREANLNEIPESEIVSNVSKLNVVDGNDVNRISSYSSEQRWYYSDSSYNYFYIRTTQYYADGYSRYISFNSYGDNMASYPCYGVTSCSTSISNDTRNITCNFTYVKYISANIINANQYRINIVFTAGGGDVNPSA